MLYSVISSDTKARRSMMTSQLLASKSFAGSLNELVFKLLWLALNRILLRRPLIN